MTALLRSRRAATDLPARLAALQEAVEAGQGRLDPEALDEAREVLARAGHRLRLSGDHTVVALAGATGSGKSSLFNALTGSAVSPVGVRRPTTAKAHAAVWGEGAGGLLDWLDVPQRHTVPAAAPDLAGLVLLDLPDHDSTETAHRLEADRLVEMVDLLVWVLDPQKYADAVLHERYLRPLAGHGEVMVVVLNQVDRLPAGQVEACNGDLERLLVDDGLRAARVLPVSARTGEGLGTLRGLLADAVSRREATTARISADVDRAAERLGAGLGAGGTARVGTAEVARLEEALGQAAGVPAVLSAVQRSYARRAAQATGLPYTRWVRRLRPDPLRRLHLEGGAGRSSLPAATPAARAQVDTAVRGLVDAASRDLPTRWSDVVRGAARARDTDLADALDVAVTGTDLGVSRRPWWWPVLGTLQWGLAIAAVAGIVWLLALAGLSYLRLPDPPTPEWRGVALPTLLLLGGVLGGLLVALLGRVLGRAGARRRRRIAGNRLRASVSQVARSHVVTPVEEELAAYRSVRTALAGARRR